MNRPLLLVLLLLLLEHLLWQQRQLRNVPPVCRDPEQQPGDLLWRKRALESCHDFLELGVFSLERTKHSARRQNVQDLQDKEENKKGTGR